MKTILMQFRPREQPHAGSLYRLAASSQGEQPPARLVIHRQLAPMPRTRKGALFCPDGRGPALSDLCAPYHWLRVTDGPGTSGPRHGVAGTSERGRHAPCSLYFGLRTTEV